MRRMCLVLDCDLSCLPRSALKSWFHVGAVVEPCGRDRLMAYFLTCQEGTSRRWRRWHPDTLTVHPACCFIYTHARARAHTHQVANKPFPCFLTEPRVVFIGRSPIKTSHTPRKRSAAAAHQKLFSFLSSKTVLVISPPLPFCVQKTFAY